MPGPCTIDPAVFERPCHLTWQGAFPVSPPSRCRDSSASSSPCQRYKGMAAANNRQPAGIPIHNTRLVRFAMLQTLTFCIKDSRPFLYSRRPGCPRPRAALKSGILIKRKPTGRRSKAVYLKKSGTFRGNRVHTLTGSAPILYNKRENPGPGLKAGLLRYTMGGWARSKWQDGVGMAVKRSKKAGGGGKYWWGCCRSGSAWVWCWSRSGSLRSSAAPPVPGPPVRRTNRRPARYRPLPLSLPAGTGGYGHRRQLGDILIHKPVLQAARQKDNTYDFTSMFALVSPYVKKMDYLRDQCGAGRLPVPDSIRPRCSSVFRLP